MTREEAIEILKQFKKCLSDVVFDEKGSEAWQMAIKALSQEPKTGHWIDYDSNEDKYDKIKCSECGHSFIVDSYHWCDIGFTKDDLNYCPNCGAKMLEPQESEYKE